MSQTKIEWADKTWSPITGCTKISEACEHCYAERMSKRLAGRCGYDKDEPFKVTLHRDKYNEPIHWRKPSRIFVCSMGDLFHEKVSFRSIALIFEMMHSAKHHTYMILTKRPERMAEFVAWFTGPEWRGAWPDEYHHVMLGVTCENQARADERIPILLQTPAAVRFVSVEPMLGPVDLTKIPWIEDPIVPGDRRNALFEIWDPAFPMRLTRHKLDWVICGGESGPGARPCHPDWARSLRDQCQESGTAFFFKSWGDWAPCLVKSDTEFGTVVSDDGDTAMARVGKKAAGRLLDGVEWSQYPGVTT